ncbi:thiamine pyrophosphate-dependent enzyme [Pleionea mediterranea]|uniref:Pyruvate oxidase n=1 Tax=Pleionea mediterranea TaxID=523701 RepID=A0A316FCA6_9GAMM|nr:thiamine pyrophosphate-dependent enzyme [Pleionea mediterranea]PWK43611.1 pyruvate oxidase [Pleionea mediterranea]
MRVADVLVDVLNHHGVEQLFGIPGDAINSIMDAVNHRSDVSFIQVKHEESGAFAASAQAKLSGRLSACVGTSGPGALHLLNGLYDAAMDNAPVVAITGQVESHLVGSQYHQEVNLESLLKDVAVYSVRVSTAEQAVRAINDACRAARSKSGVAHITISSDIAKQNVNYDSEAISEIAISKRIKPDEEAMEQTIERINNCNKITILAGMGCRHVASELIELSTKLKAPIVRTLPAKDFIDETVPNCVGGTGLLGTKPGVSAMENCELLLMLGSDFPYADFYPDSDKIIQVDTDASKLGRRHSVSLGIQGDCGLVIKQLHEQLNEKKNSTFLESLLAEKEKQINKQLDQETPNDVQTEASKDNKQNNNHPLKPQLVMHEIAKRCPDDSIFICDTGTVTVWAARDLPIKQQQRFSLSSSLGSMAYALPGAIGAKLRYPDSPVVALAGDGGFSMLMPDLLTAVRYQLPLVMVIFNNQKLGFIELEQNADGYASSGIDVTNPDFKMMSEACGAIGIEVNSYQQLIEALDSVPEIDKPTVIDVKVNPDEWVIPPKIKLKEAMNFGLSKIKDAFG